MRILSFTVFCFLRNRCYTESMNNQNNSQTPGYAYVFAIGAIILAVILLPIIWKIFKGIVKICLILVVVFCACYGAYVLFSGKRR